MSEQFSILLGNHSRLEAGQTDGAWLPKVWLYHQDKYRISAIATAF